MMICQLKFDALFFESIIAPSIKYFSIFAIIIPNAPGQYASCLPSGDHGYQLQDIPVLQGFIERKGHVPPYRYPSVRE
jgi:hypothetical protein